VPSTGNALARVLGAAADIGTYSKDEVDYRPSTDAAKRCGTCYMFSKGHCKIVRGPVDPRDVCDRWVPNVQDQASKSGPASKVGLSSLDAGQSVLVALGFVEGYERLEKGKLEHVSSYQDSRLLKPKYPTSYVIKPDKGEALEVEAHKLWLHKSEGKPGPQPMYSAGKRVTWQHHGKTHAGTVLGAPGDPGVMFTPVQGNFIDAQGGKHWGKWGAAGLLLHHTDDKGVTRYLLQQRSFGVHKGGTYSTPGGAIDRPGGLTELPEAAAFREAEEEGWGNLLKHATVTGVQQEHFGGQPGDPGTWTYHTVSAALPEMLKPSGKGSHGFENAGHKWVTPEEMAKIPLHPDFVATANKLGRPADAPNPEPPAKPSTSHNRHPLIRDDYKTGQRVTWKFNGKTAEGIVQGPAGQPEKGTKLPSHYTVQVAGEGGPQNVEVRWGEMRLHPSEAPESAKKAEQWEKQQSSGPVFPAGTSKATGAKTGYGSPTSGNVIKSHSLTLPGLTHTVPAEVNGKAVIGVLEHQKRPNLILRLEGDSAAGFLNGKVQAVVPNHSAHQSKLAYAGWKSIPFSPPQQDTARSSLLGKVVAAAEAAKPEPPPF